MCNGTDWRAIERGCEDVWSEKRKIDLEQSKGCQPTLPRGSAQHRGGRVHLLANLAGKK